MNSYSTKAIVFDFDGTIADSFAVSMSVLEHIGRRRNLAVDDSRLRGLSGGQILRELKIPLWRVFFSSGHIRRLIGEHFEEVTLIPGIADALKILAKNYTLYILSANNAANVHTFLERYDIASCFSGTYSSVAPWGKSRALSRLVHDHNLVPKETWYVGDSDLDVRDAHRAGMRSAAVTWGYSNIHMLRKRSPDALLFDTDELIDCFMPDGKDK